MLHRAKCFMYLVVVCLVLCPVEPRSIRSSPQNITTVTPGPTSTVKPTAGLPGLTDAQIIATIIGGLLGTACTIVSTIIGVCVYRRQRRTPESEPGRTRGEDIPLPDRDISDIRKNLADGYKSKYTKIPFIPWEDKKNSEIHIDKIYVPLNLQASKDTQWQKINGEEKPMDVVKIFKEFRHSHNSRVRIIVEANPGCGKSTLCHKLAYEWAKSVPLDGSKLATLSCEGVEDDINTSLLPTPSCEGVDDDMNTSTSLPLYDLVILLKARTFTTNQSISKAILDSLPRQIREQEDAIQKIKNILRNKKCLIIVDGYDELGEKDEEKQKDLTDLFNGELYCDCDLIVTTRPWCVDSLKAKDKNFTKLFKMCPFDEENIRKYAKLFFKCMNDDGDVENDMVDQFYTEVYDKGVLKLAKEPLTCLFLCAIWYKEKTLPQIRSRIYEKIIQDVMKERWIEQTQVTMLQCCKSYKKDRLKKKFNRIVYYLSRFAFEQFKKEHSVLNFRRKDFKNSKVDVDFACKVGLLTKEGKDYTFPHFSFQEFLTARYLYLNPDEFHDDEDSHTKNSKYYNISLFACGFLTMTDIATVTDEKLNFVNRITCYSVQDVDDLGKKSLYGKNISSISDDYIAQWEQSGHHQNYKWAAVTDKIIAYIYKKSIEKPDKVCLDRVQTVDIRESDDTESLDWFFKTDNSPCGYRLCAVLQKLQATKTLRILRLNIPPCENVQCPVKNNFEQLLSHNTHLELIHCARTLDIDEVIESKLPSLFLFARLTDSSLYITKNLCTSIKFIDFSHLLSVCDVKQMREHLSKFTSLNGLHLSDNSLLSSAVDVIENLPLSIEFLYLSDCSIPDEQAKLMAPYLHKLTSLVILVLSENSLTGDSLIHIIQGLPTSIKLLNLRDCSIPVEQAKLMAPHLHQLTSLEVLDLSKNSLTGDSLIHIIQDLPPSIEHLYLRDCSIPDEQAKLMVKHLQRLTSLLSVDLSNNPLIEKSTNEEIKKKYPSITFYFFMI